MIAKSLTQIAFDSVKNFNPVSWKGKKCAEVSQLW